MDKGMLEILRSDINRQSEIIDRIYEGIQERSEGYAENKERMESLAYQLHNLYCAFEDMMRIVADEFENQISERLDWHKRLLIRMTEDIPNIRPALFSQESFILLDELRGFRQWFRHAYSYKIESDKLSIVLKKADKLRAIYKMDIQNFFQKIYEKN